MGRESKHLYINLPVKHVNESKDFFEQLGFDFQQELTNEHAACFVMNETITVMLLSFKHFQSISEKELVDARNGAEVIISLQVETREEVDELVERAIAAGGSPFKEKQDHDFMYGWSFQDRDGHLWEVFYMDEERSDLS
ncbi:VOC family protein [Bacillus altitudinis]|uniref:VOC family protein n=1 Tax=Bacillus altitudinis TaxID=293387 RepID=UPI00227F19A7|nr:VOC family protein [Bacillus altitudinis]MCY7693105.1 VOC family protein [Bacillus altitudinis]